MDITSRGVWVGRLHWRGSVMRCIFQECIEISGRVTSLASSLIILNASTAKHSALRNNSSLGRTVNTTIKRRAYHNSTITPLSGLCLTIQYLTSFRIWPVKFLLLTRGTSGLSVAFVAAPWPLTRRVSGGHRNRQDSSIARVWKN